jgi:hypothetical protein
MVIPQQRVVMAPHNYVGRQASVNKFSDDEHVL